MDPRNPRWQSRSQRDRSATFWKVLVGATTGAALSAVVVVSCLGVERAGRERDDQPGVAVTTTSAMVPSGVSSSSPAATVVLGPRGAPVNIEVQTSAQPTAVVVEPEVALAPALASIASPPVLSSVAEPAPAAASITPPAPVAAPATVAADPASASDAASAAPVPEPAVADAGAPLTPPRPPELVIGAGPFSTDAPPWAASAWQSDPDAGAGRFTTEWNIPGYGYWPY